MSTPLVMIGASLGGIEALSTILETLPEDLPAAVAIVQHRGADGDLGLARLLQRRSRLPVEDVQDKDPIEPGRIYLAPPDYHLLADGENFALSIDAAVNWARPSIDVLFESACDTSERLRIAILLTASNEDGARGIQAVRRAGGVTIVQDPDEAESDVAPRAALKRARVDHVLGLNAITDCVLEHLKKATARPGARRRQAE